MIESRLEMGLRAVAWMAVTLTVVVLLAMGVFLLRPSTAGADRSQRNLESISPSEEME